MFELQILNLLKSNTQCDYEMNSAFNIWLHDFRYTAWAFRDVL